MCQKSPMVSRAWFYTIGNPIEETAKRVRFIAGLPRIPLDSAIKLAIFVMAGLYCIRVPCFSIFSIASWKSIAAWFPSASHIRDSKSPLCFAMPIQV
jgi:hypothetical protein